jgi:hypothetical protein
LGPAFLKKGFAQACNDNIALSLFKSFKGRGCGGGDFLQKSLSPAINF